MYQTPSLTVDVVGEEPRGLPRALAHLLQGEALLAHAARKAAALELGALRGRRGGLGVRCCARERPQSASHPVTPTRMQSFAVTQLTPSPTPLTSSMSSRSSSPWSVWALTSCWNACVGDAGIGSVCAIRGFAQCACAVTCRRHT